MRIVGHPKYPNAPGSPVIVSRSVAGLCRLPGHVFWPDDISLITAEHVDVGAIKTSGQVTDSYLLALAVAHAGKLATFDRRLSTDAVRAGKSALRIVERP